MAKRGSSVWRGGERRRVASDEATSAALGSELRAPELCEDVRKVLVVAVWAMWVGRGLSTSRSSSPARMATAKQRMPASVGAWVVFIGCNA